MISVYRCGKCNYLPDVSGYGAYKYGGRWNSKGNYILYTASNPSLALLECVVHMTPIMPNIAYCMLKLNININDDLIHTLHSSELKSGWEADQSLEYCKSIGDRFIKESKYLILKVPSAILPMEWNLLINPRHPLMNKLSQEFILPVMIDPRIKKSI